MDKDPHAVFRERLRELRAASGFTQEHVAERAGLNYKHYQEIERGGKQEMRFSTLIKIAAAFGIPLQHLFSLEPPRTVVQESPSPYGVKKRRKNKGT